MSGVVRAAWSAATAATARVSAVAARTSRNFQSVAFVIAPVLAAAAGALVRCAESAAAAIVRSCVVRIGLVVTGGVDASARERVVPALLWLIERLARRHDVHVFALHYHRTPRSYPLLGAMVHDLGRVDWPPGLRGTRVTARLRRAVA